MTTRQEKFARNLVAGMTQREAYRDAYPNARKWKSGNVDTAAARLAKNAKILPRVEELKRRAAIAAVLTRQARLEELSRIAQSCEESCPSIAIAAIRELNEMTGDNAPVKTETTIDILTAIAARHRDLLDESDA